MKLLLVLTGTVNPSGMALTRRADPAVRMADYANAISAWRSSWHGDILFCENSGYRLTGLPSSGLSVLQYKGNQHSASRGKGVGEVDILRNAMSSQGVSDYDYVVKCTGRLYVPNHRTVLQSLSSRSDVSSVFPGWLRSGYLDSRLIAAKPATWLRLLDRIDDAMDDSAGVYLEHALYERLQLLSGEGTTWSPFGVPPFFRGSSGTEDLRYDTPRQKLKHVRETFRHLRKRLERRGLAISDGRSHATS